MRRIAVKDLRPGQKFDKPVYVDEESLFVPEGIEIREKDIRRLMDWDVAEVMTDGQVIGEDPFQGKLPFFANPFRSPAMKGIAGSYQDLSNSLLEIHGLIRTEQPVDPQQVKTIVDEVLRLLDEDPNNLVQFILYGFQGEAGFAENAINSTILCALVGRKIKLQRHRLLNLATAALLHDIGMLRIPEEIRNKEGKLSTEELRVVRTHPIHSYKVITRELEFPEEVGLAALQHQERFDGRGYPRGLAKEKIIDLARIIAVVDSFEAMVSKRPYRDPMIGYTAMKNLLSDNGRRFDPEMLKVFIKALGLYPIGSIVLLNDGSIGRVLENDGEAPLKPTIKLLIASDGTEYPQDDGEVIKLTERRDLFIAKAVDPYSLGDGDEQDVQAASPGA
ncbi:MAG: HD-GYP domain-containing protein [Spirochaetaceae bacterium]